MVCAAVGGGPAHPRRRPGAASRVELRALGARNSTTATAARSAARNGPACRPPRMRTCVRHVRRAPLPLRLLVPRRRLAARRARGGRGAARVRRARADRPQPSSGSMEFAQAAAALGLRAIHGAEIDLEDEPPPHAAGGDARGWRNLCRLLTRAHAHDRATQERAPPPGPSARSTTVESPARRGPGVPERLRAPRGARRADAAPAARAPSGPSASASSCSARSSATTARATAALAALAGRLGRAVRGHRQRPRARAHARAAAGRVRGDAPAHDARRLGARCGAATTPTCWPRPAGDGGALRRPPRRGRRDRARSPSALTLRPHGRPRLPLSRRGGRRRPTAGSPSCAAARFDERYPRGRRQRAPRRRRAWRRSCASSTALGLPGFFLLHRDLLELAREVAVRGARAGHGARAAAAGARARVVGVLDRLLPHRPLAHRPDRQRAAARALPQRGAHRAARHRPRLPARHPRGADPARARALRARALGARRRLPDLPRARRDPRARQGARPAAGGDRARRARRGALAGAARSSATSTSRWATRSAAGRPLGLAGAALPTRPTACRATSPSTRAG